MACPYNSALICTPMRYDDTSGKYYYDLSACETCGWADKEHERRVALIRSGKVKSFWDMKRALK